LIDGEFNIGPAAHCGVRSVHPAVPYPYPSEAPLCYRVDRGLFELRVVRFRDPDVRNSAFGCDGYVE
jgi:hypothetical protein